MRADAHAVGGFPAVVRVTETARTLASMFQLRHAAARVQVDRPANSAMSSGRHGDRAVDVDRDAVVRDSPPRSM